MCDPVTTNRETTIFLICPKLNQNHPVFLFCDCRGDNNKSIRHGWRWKNLILFIYRLKCADYSQPVSHPFLWIFRKYRKKNKSNNSWVRTKKKNLSKWYFAYFIRWQIICIYDILDYRVKMMFADNCQPSMLHHMCRQ